MTYPPTRPDPHPIVGHLARLALQLAQGAPTAGDALVLGDRGYGVKMLSIADCSISRPELANEHLFRFRPTHSPKGFMSKHEDFDVTVADGA